MALIKLKRSSVAGKVPATTDLALGELAVNTVDGKIYFKKNNGTDVIVEVATDLLTAREIISASTATTNLDLGVYRDFVITLSANTTLTLSNINKKIGYSGTIVLKQDATGGRTITKATEMKTPLGGASIVQVTNANSLSVLSYYVVDASTVLINYIGNFA